MKCAGFRINLIAPAGMSDEEIDLFARTRSAEKRVVYFIMILCKFVSGSSSSSYAHYQKIFFLTWKDYDYPILNAIVLMCISNPQLGKVYILKEVHDEIQRSAI